jgi:hypothetical protein
MLWFLESRCEDPGTPVACLPAVRRVAHDLSRPARDLPHPDLSSALLGILTKNQWMPPTCNLTIKTLALQN